MTNKISIIIPSYNRPKLVVEAINSCLLQTFPAYEIIIGDDSPNESTQLAISKIQKTSKTTINYYHNYPSLGQANNVNMLVSKAKGDKILLLHDDDLLCDKCLEYLIDCFHENPLIDVAFGKQYILDDNGKVSKERSKKFNEDFYRTSEFEGSKLSSIEAAIVQQFPNNAYLINSQLFKKIKYSDAGDVCDFEFGLKLAKLKVKFYFTNKFTGKYRVWDGTISNEKNNDTALVAYSLVEQLKVENQSEHYKIKILNQKSSVAIGQALKTKNYLIAYKIYARHFNVKNLLKIQGIKDLIKISVYSPILLKEKIKIKLS
ncbi:MAG: glycosyltransferase family 2 protein [Maribacter stanieri]